jgi:putative membrane protein
MTDLVLAIFHHLLVFSLVGIIAAEFALIRPGLAGPALRRVAKLDAAYGLCALAIVVIGIARVRYSIKGAEFYQTNPWFWAKMIAFAGIGVISIVPTIALIRWRRATRAEPGFAPAAERVDRLRPYLLAELALVPVVLICAAAMARYGAF